MNKADASQIQTPEVLLRLCDVMKQTSLGHTFIYKLISEGTFPSQIKIAKKCVRWHQRDITQWIQSRSDLRMNE